MNQLKLAYEVAKTQKAVAEVSGKIHNPKIVEYHQACSLQASDDETAWCSAFVNWCVIIAGILINPASMYRILLKNKYEQADIDLFFDSAADIAVILNMKQPLITINTEINVTLPTRSAAARSWLGWGVLTNNPKEGDLVCLKRGNNAWSGHIAFFKKRGIAYLDLFGGNQGNEVKQATYSRADVLGYITLP